MTELTKEWLCNQHIWIQTAAKILMSKGSVSDEEIKSLRLLLNKEEKNPEPIVLGNFDRGSESKSEIRIQSIGNVNGIDQLSSKSTLDFGIGNLAVVYGFNGSGKSGYTRILKKACGKASAVNLKSNVFKEEPSESYCTLKYSSDANEKSVDWVANSNPIADLLAVDIYDSHSARSYVESENSISFVPQEVQFYTDLQSVYSRLDKLIQSEIDLLQTVLPRAPQDFLGIEVIRKFQNLKDVKTRKDRLDIVSWTPLMSQRIESIELALKSQDPKVEIKKLTSRKDQLNDIRTKISEALSLLSQESIQVLRDVKSKYDECQLKVDESALILEKNPEMERVSQVTWIKMWQAAKDYSESYAFPKQKFPFVSEHSKCVLCHQDLSDEAKQRLESFEDFVSNSIAKDRDAAKKAYVDLLDNLPIIQDKADLKLRIDATGLKEDVSKRIIELWNQISSINQKIEQDVFDDIPNLETNLLSELEEKILKIEDHISQLQEIPDEIDRESLSKEQIELLAKKWVFDQKQSVEAEFHRIDKISKLEKLKKLTKTNDLSTQSKRVAKNIISEEYIKRFNFELSKLGASNIKVEMFETVNRAKVTHYIRLKNLTKPNVKPNEILSEGESRVVSLAAFIADVRGRELNVPFVFDDPITSMDHEYEWKVALRLAELAKERQVIVFTHRLSLYGMLEDASKDSLVKRCLVSEFGSTGISVEEPIFSKKTSSANEYLKQECLKLKNIDLNHSYGLYKMQVQAICSDFRKLIERTVEDDLLSKVVVRHRRSINTMHLVQNLIKIEKLDCEVLDSLMSKYSFFEHSQSDQVPVNLPQYDDLLADIQILIDWRSRFDSRNKVKK